MQLALFGGTFDPPHNGHLALCLYAREILDIEKLVVSVSNNPLKDAGSASDADRIAMARLLAGIVNLTGAVAEASDRELLQQGPSYTIDHVAYLEQRYGLGDMFLLIGEDNYRDFRLWKSWEELALKCTVVVFGRQGGSQGEEDGGEEPPEHGFRVIRFEFPHSSTEIRRRLLAGEDCRGLIPSSILDYIDHHGLYRS